MMKIKSISLLVIVSVLLSACALPFLNTGSDESAAQSEETATPSPAESTPSEEPPAIGGPGNSLNETGPWWLLAGTTALWAVNADGSGLFQVISDTPVHISVLDAMVAPAGGRVAYLTYQDPAAYRGLTLKLLSLPSGGIQTLTALTSATTEPAADAAMGDPLLEAQRAITETASMAWSPDGESLVFGGVMDGSAVDLYLYQTSDGSITRLTQNTAHAITPLWAPEGGRIAFITVTTLGTGAGYGMEGFWVVDTYSGSVQAVPYLPQSGSLELIGWISPDTLLVDTWTALCGSSQLTAVRIPDGATTTLWEGCFNGYKLAYDSNSGVVLTVVENSLAQFNPQPGSGLLWADAKSGTNQWISANEGYQIDFLAQAGLFSASSASDVLLISPDGSVAQTLTPPATGAVTTGYLPTPVFSSDASTWALTAPAADTQPTLWVGESSGQLHTLSFEDVQHKSFVPGQNSLLMQTASGLYLASAPDFAPVSSGEDASVLNNNVIIDAWVLP